MQFLAFDPQHSKGELSPCFILGNFCSSVFKVTNNWRPAGDPAQGVGLLSLPGALPLHRARSPEVFLPGQSCTFPLGLCMLELSSLDVLGWGTCRDSFFEKCN